VPPFRLSLYPSVGMGLDGQWRIFVWNPVIAGTLVLAEVLPPQKPPPVLDMLNREN
jgi:hypothetical protein